MEKYDPAIHDYHGRAPDLGFSPEKQAVLDKVCREGIPVPKKDQMHTVSFWLKFDKDMIADGDGFSKYAVKVIREEGIERRLQKRKGEWIHVMRSVNPKTATRHFYIDGKLVRPPLLVRLKIWWRKLWT